MKRALASAVVFLALYGATSLRAETEFAGQKLAHATLGASNYPRRAIDAQGAELVLTQAPLRIVSLEYEIDEYAYLIAPPERVVGVSDLAYRPQISNVLDQVNAHRPAVASDVETIIRLNPDLVLAADRSRPDLVQALRQAGINVFLLFTLATRLDEVAENITVTGYLLGRDEAAEQKRAAFEAERAGIAEQCRAPHPRARVFGVSMIGYSFGDATLFHDQARLVGAINVGAENGLHTYQKVGSETVLRWNPDWVFTWSDPGRGAEELKRWTDDPVLGAIAAVEKKQVIVSDGKDHLSLSPMAVKLTHTMADAICVARR